MSKVVGGVIFIVSFTVYLLTMAPTVTFVDSGELMLAAVSNGVAHPPGFPFYVILAHAASLVPLGSIAERIHFVSVLFAALTSAAVALFVLESLNTRVSTKTIAEDPLSESHSKSISSADQMSVDSFTLMISGLSAGLLLAFSRTLWSYATIAEVYALNLFLIAGAIALVFKWRRRFISVTADGGEPAHTLLYSAAFLYGLGLAVHHVTVALTIPAVALVVYSTAGKSIYLTRKALYAGLAAVAGLSVYLYLPIAASRDPLLNWGDPHDLEQFWWHISGRQYQVFFDFSLSRISEFLGIVLRDFGSPWAPLALVVAFVGIVATFRRDRVVFWFFILIIAANVGYCLSYDIADDKDAYYMPALLAVVGFSAFGSARIVSFIDRIKAGRLVRRIFVTAVMLILPSLALIFNFALCDRSRFFIAYDYVENIQRSVGPNGLVLTADWQTYSPSLYVRDIEGNRKDTAIVDIRLMRRFWYYQYLEQAYPRLTAPIRGKIDLLVEDLVAFERDPRSFIENPVLNQRIDRRYHDVLYSLVAEQLKQGPVYFTADLAEPANLQDTGLMKEMGERYDLYPQGLVFNVGDRSSPPDPQLPELKLRGLNDGTVKLSDHDVVRRSVLPVYLNMMTNNGIYMALRGQEGRAVSVFKKVLTIDPSFGRANAALSAALRR